MLEEGTVVRKAYQVAAADASLQIISGMPDNETIGVVLDKWKGR